MFNADARRNGQRTARIEVFVVSMKHGFRSYNKAVIRAVAAKSAVSV
jgi:hypothetical protein